MVAKAGRRAFAVVWLSASLLPGAALRAQTVAEPPVEFEIDGTVKRVRLVGAPEEISDRLTERLALAGQRQFLIRRSQRFQNSLLHEDLERVRLYLARHGYPWARVRPEIVPRESPGEVDLFLHIDAGPAIRIAESELIGWPPGLERPNREVLPPLSGSVLVDDEIAAIEEALRGRLADEGYALASVESRIQPTGEHRVRLRWDVTAGSQFRFGAVEVSGVADDLERAARRSLSVYEGEPYAERRLEDAEYRLQQLQLFQRIQLSVAEFDSTTLALRCKLSPRSPRRLRLGVGWSTDIGPGAEAEWRHANLFHEGRGLAFDASVSQYLTSIGATTWWPGLLHPHFLTTLGWRDEWAKEDSYEQFSQSLKLGLEITLGPLVYVQNRIEVSYINLDNVTETPELDEVLGFVTSVGSTFVRDKTNDRFDPTSGTVLTVDADATPPGIGSNAEYWRSAFSWSGYRHLGTPGTLAGRANIGIGQGFGVSDELIASERFYAGGSRTHRGYERHRLGPLDEEGLPIGGEFALTSSIELRKQLFKKIYGAAFVDGGQVYGRLSSADKLPIRWAVGPGLYTSTPIGVARIDLGILLADPPPDASNVVFHFSIGHPF